MGRARRRKRRGLRRRPIGGWPLDELLVGVATLRTTRELFRQSERSSSSPPRAWDLALWSGVTPQGSADALERMEKVDLVTRIPSRFNYRADAFRLDRGHPLVDPLAGLFAAETRMSRWEKIRRR